MPTFIRPDKDAKCDPRHLAEQLGVEHVDIEQEKVHVHGEPPTNAQAIIDAYVYDPDFGKSDDDKLIDAFSKNPNPNAAQTAAALKAMLRSRR